MQDIVVDEANKRGVNFKGENRTWKDMLDNIDVWGDILEASVKRCNPIKLSQKEIALLSTNYPNTEKYQSLRITNDDWRELLRLTATLTSVGNIRNKDHLIGETKDFYEWTRIFTPAQCRKLQFATPKHQAREQIRNLKKIIHNSTEKLTESLVNNHYKTANAHMIILSNNMRELNDVRSKIKANKSTISQNNA